MKKHTLEATTHRVVPLPLGETYCQSVLTAVIIPNRAARCDRNSYKTEQGII